MMRKPSEGRDISRLLFRGLCALVFVWMLILNCFTPYVADDYSFSYAFAPAEKIRLYSLPQLLGGLAYHYMTWSGRVVVKFFAQAFTMMPKAVFNLCNAAAYTALGVVIYTLARRNAGRAHSPALFLFIQIALWFFSPVFGQTNLWMCGSCNYLWSTLGCLAFLLLCLSLLDRPSQPRGLPAGMLALGFVAGALSENASAGLLVGLAALLALCPLQKKRIPGWLAAALAGCIGGYAFLLLAPGNYSRSDAAPDPRPPLTRFAVRFLSCCRMLTEYALPLLALIVFLAALLWFIERDLRVFIVPGILFLCGMAANFAMIGSPVYYERSTHGVFTFLTACAAGLVARLQDALPHRLPDALIAAACVPLVFSMIYAGYDIASFGVMDANRAALLREQAATGEKETVSYAIACYTPYCAAYGLPELLSDGNDAISMCRALSFDFYSIRAVEVHTYPFPGRLPAYTDDMLTLLNEAQLAELQER